MRFLDLYISGFGKFHDTAVSFEDGLNIVYGKNEAGKSTIHTFIRSMLFGLERQRGRAARTDIYSKYEPWENSGTYEGQLRLESDGVIYRIERSFQKNRKEFTLINETSGREETDGKAVMDEILGGISETAYNNTISISQLKSATDSGMVSELKNYIANMNTSGNMALNITRATAHLKKQKKELEGRLHPEAAQTYTSLLTEIRSLEKELSAPEYENQLAEYAAMRDSVRKEIELQQREADELSAKLEQGRKMLGDFAFSDCASIQSYLEHTESIYRDFVSSGNASRGKTGGILSALFSLLVLAGAGIIWYYGFLHPGTPIFGSFPPLPADADVILFCALAGGASLISLVASLVLALRNRHFKQMHDLSRATLSEIFSRHLNSDTVSEKAMNDFRSRMDDFLRLSETLRNSENALKTQNEQIASLREKQDSCNAVIETQQRTQWELEKKLEHLSNCKDRALALKQVIRENEKIREDISAIELAQETLKDLSMSIRDSFGLYLNKTASELISGITGGRYYSMSIDENLNAFLNTSRKLIPLDQVSSGTADQIYLALRLAAARFIQGGSDRLPLVFDDSFVLYDDERLTTALTWLSETYKGQIIVFTCHTREEKVLNESDVPFHAVHI